LSLSNPLRRCSRMLKKSASGVLASLKSSTYRMRLLEVGSTRGCLSVRQDPLQGRTAHTKCGVYLLASSLAAALLGRGRVSARQGWAGEKSGHFEHPAWYSHAVTGVRTSEVLACHNSFSTVC
jgi:hypothetical protein